MAVHSTSNVTEELTKELHLCKEKNSSLEEQNRQLDLQGSKVIKPCHQITPIHMHTSSNQNNLLKCNVLVVLGTFLEFL